MTKLVGLVVLSGCLMTWRAQGQALAAGDAGLYVSPAYAGDFGGLYVSPAYSGGDGLAAGMGTGAGLDMGVGGQSFRRAPEYEGSISGAYSTPAFSRPVVGFRVSPPPAKPETTDGKGGVSGSGGTAGTTTGVGKADPPVASGQAGTNRVDTLAAPPGEKTNAPAGQESNSKP